MTDRDVPIGMLAAYARFSRDEQSEIFGFWYFQEMGLPSTREAKRAFFHDLMTGRCCQLSLKGSMDQILEIIEASGQGGGKMPPYSSLVDALKQHSTISVTFDDLMEAKGTSLELNLFVLLTDPMESIVAKVKNRRDVVDLEIDSGWSLLTEMSRCILLEEEAQETDIVAKEPEHFDEDTYAKARPHFEATWECFSEEGKGIKEYFRFLIEKFGPDIKPYVMRFLGELKQDSTPDLLIGGHDMDDNIDDLSNRYVPNTRDRRLVKTATKMLTNIIQSGRLSPAQLVSVAKILHVYSRFPEMIDAIDIQVSVTTPRRWFGDIETYYWWDVKVRDSVLRISGGGHFYRKSTGGDTFSVMDWTITPGEEAEYVDYASDLRIVPNVQTFEEAIEGLDFSERLVGISVDDPDNEWLDECDDDSDIEDENI